MLAIRLNEDLENELNSKLKRKTSYELGEDLFALASSGKNDLSITYKKRLKNKLNTKYIFNK